MSERAVLVGLRNPVSMGRLLETGQQLARVLGGEMVSFCVAGPSSDGWQEFGDRLYGVAERACEQLSAARPLRVEAADLSDGLVAALQQVAPSHLLLGYAPHRQEDVSHRRNTNRVLGRALKHYRGHAIVAHFGEPREMHRILVPLASEANLEPIGQLARALLTSSESLPTLAQVVPAEATAERAQEASSFLLRAAEACRLTGRAQFRIENNDDVAEGILEMAWEHDAVILGTPSRLSLSERMFGTLADHVAGWTRCTSFLVRAGQS